MAAPSFSQHTEYQQATIATQEGNMNRNYRTPTVAAEWANSRETDMAVAVAIHAIADSSRSAEEIWEAPTAAEVEHVTMAIEEYVRHGDFDYDPDGYCWGQEIIRIEVVH